MLQVGKGGRAFRLSLCVQDDGADKRGACASATLTATSPSGECLAWSRTVESRPLAMWVSRPHGLPSERSSRGTTWLKWAAPEFLNPAGSGIVFVAKVRTLQCRPQWDLLRAFHAACLASDGSDAESSPAQPSPVKHASPLDAPGTQQPPPAPAVATEPGPLETLLFTVHQLAGR